MRGEGMRGGGGKWREGAIGEEQIWSQALKNSSYLATLANKWRDNYSL